MMDDDNYALGEMDRRLANLVRFGTIAAVDVANALAKVDLGDLVTDWLPWSAARAGENRVWMPPDIGEQVVLVSPGDPSQGAILGSLWQAAHPANGNAAKDFRITFKDGTVVEQDRDTGALNVQASAGGSIRLNVGGTTLLLQSGQATLTTPLFTVDAATTTFTGDVSVAGDLGISGSTIGNGVNLNTHTHSGVQAGGSNSGPPS